MFFSFLDTVRERILMLLLVGVQNYFAIWELALVISSQKQREKKSVDLPVWEMQVQGHRTRYRGVGLGWEMRGGRLAQDTFSVVQWPHFRDRLSSLSPSLLLSLPLFLPSLFLFCVYDVCMYNVRVCGSGVSVCVACQFKCSLAVMHLGG